MDVAGVNQQSVQSTVLTQQSTHPFKFKRYHLLNEELDRV
jgi:hypothetical protein